MARFRDTTFFKTLRESAAALVDEALFFASFLAALLGGLYFASWWVFFGCLLAGIVLVVLAGKLIRAKKKD